MSDFKTQLSIALGPFREKSVLLTVGNQKGQDSLKLYTDLFKNHFEWVSVCESPNSFVQHVQESKPDYIVVDDKFFGSFQMMIDRTAGGIKSYDGQLPYVFFLCSDSIRFISNLIKTKIPTLKTSAIFHKPLRNVTLYAYLLGLAHQQLETGQGIKKTPLGELMKKYEKAVFTDNHALLHPIIELMKQKG